MLRTLRRPGGYVAAVVVGIVAVLTGLPWWAGVAAAALALILGTLLASALAGAGERAKRPVEPPTPSAAAAADAATFRLEGEYWTLAFRGPAFSMRDSKGLRYIHRLLQAPGVEVHALDLVLVGQTVPGVPLRPAQEGIHPAAPVDQPVLDRQALQAYRARLGDLKDQIEEAEANNDTERAARAREELDSILDQLERETTPVGSRRFRVAETERARLNVTRAIKSAISKVRTQDASLGHHLDHSIRTGTYCCYEPDPANTPTWAL